MRIHISTAENGCLTQTCRAVAFAKDEDAEEKIQIRASALLGDLCAKNLRELVRSCNCPTASAANELRFRVILTGYNGANRTVSCFCPSEMTTSESCGLMSEWTSTMRR